jgi:hypothetical protein
MFMACVSDPPDQNQINSFSLLLTRRDGIPVVNNDTLNNGLQRNRNVEVYKFVVHQSGQMEVSFGEGKFHKKKIEFVKTNTVEKVQLKSSDVDSLFNWVYELKKRGNYITKNRINDSWSVQLNVGSIQRNYYDGEFLLQSGATTHEKDITRLLVKNSPIKVRYYPN